MAQTETEQKKFNSDNLVRTPEQINAEPRCKTKVLGINFPDSLTLVLQLEKPKDFTFKAGQYIWLVLPERTKAPGLVDRRAYSITSSPSAEYLEIVIRKTDSDYLKAVGKLRKASAVEIIGPFGSTFVPPQEGLLWCLEVLGLRHF